MIISYRGTQLADGEASIKIDRPPLQNQMGEVYGYTERWTIEACNLQNSVAGVTAALAQLEALFSVDGGDLILYQSDGVTPTQHVLYSSQSASGTRVVSRPTYPTGNGAEYVYFRHYVVVIEAEFHINASQVQYDFFEERIEFSGGGPMVIWVPILNGTPQGEQAYPAMPYTAVQSGRAVGLYGYPPLPSPLFPGYLSEGPSYTYGSAQVLPGPNRQLRHFPVEWSYKFASDGPLFGLPRNPP